MRRMKRARSSRSSRLRPAEGSSSSSTRGSSASARAKPTIFWMPKGRAPTGAMAVALELDELDDLLDRLAVARSPRGARSAGTASRQADWCAMRAWRPVRRLSSTLMCGNSSPCWKVRAMPSRAMSCGAMPAMSLPRKRMRPVAAVDAADAVEDAGLAGAVGADQREQLARLDRKRDAVQHRQAAEAQASDARSRAQPYHLRLRRYCLTSR